MRGEGGSRVTSKLKQGAHIHQPAAWQLPHTCAQPYQVAVAAIAWHTRRSVNGENPCFLYFGGPRGVVRCPKAIKTKGAKLNRQKEKTKLIRQKRNKTG